MIVFQGFGFLAPMLMVLGQILALEAARHVVHTPVPENATNGLGMLLAAPVVWLLGRWLLQDPVRLLFDPITGKQVKLRNRQMEWWGLILAVLGSVLLATSLLVGKA